jgi:hypothetical protein
MNQPAKPLTTEHVKTWIFYGPFSGLYKNHSVGNAIGRYFIQDIDRLLKKLYANLFHCAYSN